MEIKVTRAFFLAGDVQPVDSVIEVEKNLGRELIHNGKAVEVPPEEKPAEEKTAKAARAAKKGKDEK